MVIQDNMVAERVLGIDFSRRIFRNVIHYAHHYSGGGSAYRLRIGEEIPIGGACARMQIAVLDALPHQILGKAKGQRVLGGLHLPYSVKGQSQEYSGCVKRRNTGTLGRVRSLLPAAAC